MPPTPAAAAATAAVHPDVAKFFTAVAEALVKHPHIVHEIGGVFLFNIKGAPSWLVDLKSPPGSVKMVTQAQSVAPDCTLAYASVADFVAINAGKMDLKRAIFTGKFKLQGNMKVLQRMHEVMEAARKKDAEEDARRRAALAEADARARAPSYAEQLRTEGAAAAPSARRDSAGDADTAMSGRSSMTGRDLDMSMHTDASGLSHTGLRQRKSSGRPTSLLASISRDFLPQSASSRLLGSPEDTATPPSPLTVTAAALPGTWTRDADVNACVRCTARFTFTRRKHHCRTCGRIFCSKCSSRSVGGNRTCDWCMQRLYGAAPTDGIDIPDPTQRARQFAGAGGVRVTTAFAAGLAMASGHGSDSITPSTVASHDTHVSRTANPLMRAATDTPMSAPLARVATAQASQDGAARRPKSAPGGQPGGAQSTDGASVHSEPVGAPLAKSPSVASLDDASGAVQIAAPASDAPAGDKRLNGHLRVQPPSPGGSVTSFSQQAAGAQVPHPASAGDYSSSPAPAPEAIAGMHERLAELETRVRTLQEQAELASTVPELQEPDMLSVLARVELASAFLLPAMWIVAMLGWRFIPLMLLWFGTTGVLGAAGWVGRLVWLACLGAGAWVLYYGTSDSDAAQLYRRRMRVYGASFVAFADYKLTKALLQHGGITDGSEADAVWEATNRRNAARAFRIIRDLRGLWVKCGQYLSSRPDVMPPAYIKVFSALQDSMPARPLAEVRVNIEESLGKPIDTVFSFLSEKALAAASIGQVHRGTLRDGTEVAVKVQHRGMDVIIRQDLENLRIVLDYLAWVETGFDLRGVMSEWLKEIINELDFTKEATNMTEVRNNMMATDIAVTVPRVIPGLVSQRVLVMRFIQGVKISDVAALDKRGVDRDQLVDRVCTAYAHQIYRNGFFNGDPHPGNIMITRLASLVSGDPSDPENARLRRITGKACTTTFGEDADALPAGPEDDWIPVLLDFGLTKRLPDTLRVAFGKLVVSAEEMDYAGMMESMDAMGMRFSTESAAEDLENLQYMFRDATPASEARSKHEERERKKAEKQAKEREVEAASLAAGKKKKEDRKMTAWPTEIMFYLRASELLQGLASHLGTRHSFLHTMAHAARLGQLDAFPLSVRAALPVFPALIPPQAVTRLEKRLRHRLAMLRKRDAYLGLQVVVMHGGKTIADVCAGEMGPLDPRPVTPTTLFPVLGASRVGVAAAVTALLATGQVSLSNRVEMYWKAFAAAGKGGCTVGDVLRGRSGVEGALPEDLSTTALTRAKFDEVAAEIARAQPLLLPSMVLRHRSHGTSFASRTSFLAPSALAGDASGPLFSQDASASGDVASPPRRTTQAAAAADHLPSVPEGAEGVPTPSAASPSAFDDTADHGAASEQGESQSSGAAAGMGMSNRSRPAVSVSAPSLAHAVVPASVAHMFHGRLQPVVGPGASVEITTHLWLGWGIALAAMLQGVARSVLGESAGTLDDVLYKQVCAPLGIAEHATFGVKPGQAGSDETARRMARIGLGLSGALDGTPAERPRTSARAAGAAAGTSNGEPANAVSEAANTASRNDETVSVATSDQDGDGVGAGAEDADAAAASDDKDVTMAAAMAAMELAEVMGSAGLNELTSLMSGGREHFMDPRLLNMGRMRESLLPVTNLYASARGLAAMMRYVATTPLPISASSGGAAAPSTLALGDVDYHLPAVTAAHNTGLRLYKFQRERVGGAAEASESAASSLRSVRVHYSAVGCGGLGGSLAFHDTARDVTVAVTVNRLSADRAIVQHVVDIVCDEMDLGVPLDL